MIQCLICQNNFWIAFLKQFYKIEIKKGSDNNVDYKDIDYINMYMVFILFFSMRRLSFKFCSFGQNSL